MDWYDHHGIEKKWQAQWEKDEPFRAKDFASNEKAYVLVEFPYPSGDGLHVGHVRSYTAFDAIARKKRMEGRNVLYPMGWDAFGLPTENYAIRTGIHPRTATNQNIATFRRQMKALGLSFDWSREFDTTDPKYYRWTQWIFLQFFKKGLAYQATIPINWCPKDKIGLANEEVVNGKCERCGTAVIRRQQKQWLLKITAYADRLLKDLDTVDYLDKIKTQQVNWIGRSEGAEVVFRVPPVGEVVLLHGFTGTPEENFLPWVKQTLSQYHVPVQTPRLPNTENPDITEQVKYAEAHCTFTETTTVAGLSLGAVVALKVVERLKKPIQRLILIAGFANPKFKDHTRPFENTFDWKFDWGKIRKNASKIILLHDTHDPAVTDEQITELEKNLGVQATRVQAGEPHFDAEIEPEVLNAILPEVTVFTTRPDTLFGATYLVLAPEHSLVNVITTAEQRDAIQTYQAKVQKKSDLERTDLAKEKTGVFTGAYAVNPVNKEKIPIWIADYVLATYGTGAIMAVPAHDDRDRDFAKKFDLPIRQVIAPHIVDTINPPREGKKNTQRVMLHAIVKHPTKEEFLSLRWKEQPWRTFITGGVEEGEDPIEAGLREIHEETGFRNARFVKKLPYIINAEFYAAHKDVNRNVQANILFYQLDNLERDTVADEEKALHEPEWTPMADMKNLSPVSELSYVLDWLVRGDHAYVGEGVLMNSGPFNKMESQVAGKAIVQQLSNGKNESSEEVSGFGILLETEEGTYLFQERDSNTKRDPGMLTPFGGGTKKHESVISCIQRELKEELELDVPPEQVEHIGIFPSLNTPGTSIATFLLKKVRRDALVLHEGKNIVELSLNDALKNNRVTEFTKKVLRTIQGGGAEREHARFAVQYKLRDWIFSRQHYWGEPIPIIHCPDHGPVPVPEDQLPVELPHVEKYQPTDTGESPLATETDWVNTECPICHKPAKRETDTMPNWAASSWYFLRYCDPTNDTVFADRKKLEYWMPVDLYNGGMEHTVLHLLYSRFWYKFLADEGLVPGIEPYRHRHSHGVVLAEDNQKMSKSRGNVINPDDLIREYGADTVRVYELFMGPFEDTIPWSTRGMIGVHRFLQKVHDLAPNTTKADMPEGDATEMERQRNYAIKKVSDDLEAFRFNTAVSTLMEFTNLLWKVKGTSSDVFAQSYKTLLILLFPMAPHLASELWERAYGGDVSAELWPTFDASKLQTDTIELVVQINGKVRAKIRVPAGLSQSEAERAALENANIKRYVSGKPKKTIFVPNKLVNLVV